MSCSNVLDWRLRWNVNKPVFGAGRKKMELCKEMIALFGCRAGKTYIIRWRLIFPQKWQQLQGNHLISGGNWQGYISAVLITIENDHHAKHKFFFRCYIWAASPLVFPNREMAMLYFGGCLGIFCSFVSRLFVLCCCLVIFISAARYSEANDTCVLTDS